KRTNRHQSDIAIACHQGINDVFHRVVFTSGVPLVMMGLDLTNQTVCTPDVIARMERAGGPAGELFSDIMNFTLKTQFENYGLAGGPVHDATCIGYLINPDGIKTQ
ncbi:nucleoside hydrolase, partial [Escherichia sp. TWPC-MK]